MEEITKNHYELTYIVTMAKTVDELPAVKKEVTDLLTQQGGENLKEQSMGKLKFAYPINKMSHGYYEVVEFDLAPDQLKEVDDALKLSNNIIRHLLVTKRIKSEEELAAEQRLREKIAKQDEGRRSIFDEEEEGDSKPARKRVPKKPVKREKEKVSIEDLDKKLDSILEGEDMLQ